MNTNSIDKSSIEKAVIEFELAIIKELYKNSKIGSKEYEYSINKLSKKLEQIEINSNLFPIILDLKI